VLTLAAACYAQPGYSRLPKNGLIGKHIFIFAESRAVVKRRNQNLIGSRWCMDALSHDRCRGKRASRDDGNEQSPVPERHYVIDHAARLLDDFDGREGAENSP
jgi:hypothetical protein